MLIPPKYNLTPKISQFLQSIEAAKEVINSANIPPELELNIRRQSSLRSSLFSARIEGNTLTLNELPKVSSKDQKKAEVFNILKALNWVQSRKYKQSLKRSLRSRYKDITLVDILNLHKTTMQGLVETMELGKTRTSIEAIFNKSGIAIYLPPRPSQVIPLMQKLIIFSNSSKETFVPVRACLAHYTFEKIHPFVDGNGRVGRLLLQMVLLKGGYGMKGLAAIEEFLDLHRADYYHALEDSEKDVTDYLEFMLEAIAASCEEAKQQILAKNKIDLEDLLLPRRVEILNIIKDHKIINFNSIKRRFLSVNERTLRYDLKYLMNQGLIKKRGTTKGVWYQISAQPLST